jgi:hypothetical protein
LSTTAGGKSQRRFDPKAEATRIFEKDVACAVRIAIHFQSTLTTLKHLAATELLVDPATAPTGLGRVSFSLLESSLTESAPRIFRSLKVRAEKVRRFPFWKCAHAKPAHFQIPGNQVRQSKVRRFPFLRMREIKIQGTQKVRGASLIRLLTGPSGKVRTEKVRRFPFWECALSNSWNAMRGFPAHNQIRGTQKHAQVCILFSELCQTNPFNTKYELQCKRNEHSHRSSCNHSLGS